MRWVTRAGVHIDRAGSAWLIRRFIDHDATFEFVTDPDDIGAGAVPFDMRRAEFSHVVLRGLSMTVDDDQVIDLGAAIFNGLYAYFHRTLLAGRDPA